MKRAKSRAAEREGEGDADKTQTGKSKQSSQLNPSIDPGKGVILPGGGVLHWPGSQWVLASSVGSHWGYSAFNQAVPSHPCIPSSFHPSPDLTQTSCHSPSVCPLFHSVVSFYFSFWASFFPLFRIQFNVFLMISVWLLYLCLLFPTCCALLPMVLVWFTPVAVFTSLSRTLLC